MKNYIKHHPWSIIEDGFDPSVNRVSESLFSIGNGRMGQRGNFEEDYGGDKLVGSYLGGIYYPDKTRVGWWKNGYPEYFAKVLNSVNWIGLHIHVNGILLDLHSCKVIAFRRELNMQEGVLYRTFKALMPNGIAIEVASKRIYSMTHKDLGLVEYKFTTDRAADIEIDSYLDGLVKNQDANYDEIFWETLETGHTGKVSFVRQRTKKTAFDIWAGVQNVMTKDSAHIPLLQYQEQHKAGHKAMLNVEACEEICIQKFAVITSSQYHEVELLGTTGISHLQTASNLGMSHFFNAQKDFWREKWEESDIEIAGDISAQQAIRFNIFQLYQTYTGEDARLNIGPKGFTGEKYGGSTYWDTEAYCLPFYMSTAAPEVSRNLLIYRYKQLDKAIENASKLGFSNGAALYPMVTMNGEECHNEWEITFEEIHRNGAIAYAIFDYIRYTGDESYMSDYGLEVLIAIARFWAQRITYSENRKQYVMLGVTGPNEFENNVNNNWYTNKLAVWCMHYAGEQIALLRISNKEEAKRILAKTNFKEEELKDWKNRIDNMYFPYDDERGIFLQQDGFLDKELIPVKDIPKSQRPIVEHWSWDRILRSCYIKQADVLQGFYFFEDEYDLASLRRHYDFYEPLTVHESSLSPCVHSILAAKLGDENRAYEFYLRTARLDLDDINNDTRDGCHITSMAGTWMSIAKGFAGMRVSNNHLHFAPFIPKAWTFFSFKIRFRQNLLLVEVNQQGINITNLEGESIRVNVFDNTAEIASGSAMQMINQTTKA